jgi:dipeptidyl-peptidase-3
VFLEWREIMMADRPARQIFVQGNTFVEGGEVVLREYEESVEGVVRSWAERGV